MASLLSTTKPNLYKTNYYGPRYEWPTTKPNLYKTNYYGLASLGQPPGGGYGGTWVPPTRI